MFLLLFQYKDSLFNKQWHCFSKIVLVIVTMHILNAPKVKPWSPAHSHWHNQNNYWGILVQSEKRRGLTAVDKVCIWISWSKTKNRGNEDMQPAF